MSDELTKAQGRLEEFNRRHSREGLFLRYCHGTVSHFRNRNILMVVSGVAISLAVGPLSGFVYYLVVALADAANTLYAVYAIRLAKQGRLNRRTCVISMMVAGVQAGGFCLCAIHLWTTGIGSDARFLSVIGLVWMLTVAGVLQPFFPEAAKVRMSLYGITIMGLFARDLFRFTQATAEFTFDAVAAFLCLVMTVTLMRQRTGYFHTRVAYQRDLLKEQIAVEKSRKALRENEQHARQLALVAENANDSVLITDATGEIAWVNDAFTKLLGYSSEEVIGQPVQILNGPETSAETVASLVGARAAGKSHRCQILNYTKSGKEVWIETSLTPVADESGKVVNYVAIERDIGMAIERERALADARKAAEEAGRAKTNFLATMSHEIRTPMNGIVGTAALLNDTPLSDEQRIFVDTIADSGEALLSIINDTLDYTKLGANKLELEALAFSPARCVTGTVELLRPIAAGKGLLLEINLPKANQIEVLGDVGRLRQILLNLLGNAIKFTESGSVTLALRQKIDARQVSLEIAVRDTGIGIAADKLTRVFDTFTQADSSVTRKFGGTGLGLSISRQLVEAMGGTLRVTSEPGAGSCFTLSLTLLRAPDVVRSNPVQGDTAPAPSVTPSGIFYGKTVLIAEDNKTNRFLLGKMLESTGATLLIACNGEEAVSIFRDARPDLILMDIQMPLKDGYQATREIRAQEQFSGNPPVPVIALTANAFEEDRRRCIEAGMDGFLTKPLRKPDLLRQMTIALAAGFEKNTTPASADRVSRSLAQEAGAQEAGNGGRRNPGLQSQVED